MSSGATPRFREYKLKSTVHPIHHNVMIMPEKNFSFHDLVPPVKLARHKIDYHAQTGSTASPQLSSSLPAINLLYVSDNANTATNNNNSHATATANSSSGSSSNNNNSSSSGNGNGNGNSMATSKTTSAKSTLLSSSLAASSPKLDAHGDVVSIAPYGGGSANQARKPFKKKTQIFMHEFTKEDDDARKLRIEESKPWVLEDHDNRAWQGRLEGGQQQKYVLFVNQGNEFRVIMVNKWYHFTSKIHYQTLSLEEAEKQMALKKRDNESDRWMMRDKKKAMSEDPDVNEASKKKSKIGVLRAQLKSDYLGTPDYDDPFNFDDMTSKKKKKKDELEFEGIDEEIDFEEVFDDDEVFEPRGDEEDERAEASKYKKTAVDADEEEDASASTLNSAGKALKKTLKHLDKGNLYESDEEFDPYAGSDDQDGSSSTSASEDEEEMTPGGVKKSSNRKGQQPSSSQEDPMLALSQPLSSSPPSPRTHQYAAAPKELSSPKANPSKSASTGTLMKGPKLSTTTAPMAKKIKMNPPATMTKSSASPPSSPAPGLVSSSGTPSPVLSRSSSPPGITNMDLAATADIPAHLLLTEQDIIAHLKDRPIRTKDLITLIKPKLKLHPGNKDRFRLLVKKLATVKPGSTEEDRLLELREEYK